MKLANLEALHEEYKRNDSPAQQITEFLLKHSNSSEYLAGNLHAIAKAALADYHAERELMDRLLKSIPNRD